MNLDQENLSTTGPKLSLSTGPAPSSTTGPEPLSESREALIARALQTPEGKEVVAGTIREAIVEWSKERGHRYLRFPMTNFPNYRRLVTVSFDDADQAMLAQVSGICGEPSSPSVADPDFPIKTHE